VPEAPSQEELEAAHCWEAEDRVPRRPETTAFRRLVRFHQSRWRESHGHPIGSQPIVPREGKPVRPVGNRLPLDYAQETGANFVTAAAFEAAKARTAAVEPHQTFDHQRFWADLLWSPALAVNLFAGPDADRAVRAVCPDAPGTVRETRFEYSPGRFDAEYLNSLRTFDAAVLIALGGGTQGILAVDVKYHERLKAEIPKPSHLPRYLEVADRSGAFAPGAIDRLKARSELAVTWLEHLLLLSMLQHPSGTWRWGRYVVVRAAGNPDMAELVERYPALLADESTFASVTLEELLGPGPVRDRYVAA
jgi:hypothetical protein